MANRFWVGGTSTWDATAGTKWALTSGGAGGQAVPTASDDVFFDASSGVGTVTTVGTTTCLTHNINFTGFTGTLLHDTSTTITCSGSLTMAAGMTYTRNASALWTFNATTTGNTINFAGKGATGSQIGLLTFNGVGGGWAFTAGFTASATATITLTNGALDFGGQTISFGLFSSSNSNTRTITLGASNITLTGTGTVWDCTVSTNLTMTGDTSTVTSTGSNTTVRGAGPNDAHVNFNNLSMTGAGNASFFYGNAVNFTRTGTAVKTDGINFTEVTVLGTLTLTGNSVTNRLLALTAHGATGGIPTPATLTAAAVSLTNVDFMDITGAGAAAPFTGTSLGDAGGNSNITFDTPVTQSPGMAYLDGTGLVLPGVAGHYASIPNAAALQITGDIDIRCKVNVANWTSTSFQSFIGKRAGGSSTEYAFRMAATTGKLDFYWFESGASRDFVSSVAVPFANGTTQWVRATRSNTGGPAGVSQVTFYTSSDGSIWTQLGIAVNGASAANPTSTTNPVLVGASSNNDGNPLIGTVYETIILNGINGTTVLDANFAGATSRATSFTESSSNAATVTVVQADVSWSTASWTSRIPLPQDSVTIPGLINSTLTSNMPRLGGSIDFTGSTGGTLTFSTTGASYGSLNFNSGLAITTNASAQLTLSGRSNYTITSNGAAFPGGANGVIITAPGGTYTLQDNALWTANFSVTAGGFNTNNFNLTCNLMTATGSLTRSVTLDNSTITMVRTSAGSIFQVTSTGLTLSAANTTFVYAQTSPNAHSFDGAGYTYGALQITGGKGTSFAITGANTFTGGVTVTNPDTVLTWPSSTTNTIGSLSATGQNFGYQRLPGVTSNYIATPDSIALSIIGDIDIRARVSLDTWIPASNQFIISKAPPGDRAYSMFIISPGGAVVLQCSLDGTNLIGANSTVAPTISNGQVLWLRATRRSSDGQVQFFTANGGLANPVAADFTQLGANVSTTAGAIWDAGSELQIGSHVQANGLIGNYYRLQIRNGLDGTVALDSDFTAKAFGANSFAESSTNAATITINGTQAQAGDGRVLINSSIAGTAATLAKAGPGVVSLDYVTIQDIAATPTTHSVSAFAKQSLIPIGATLSLSGAVAKAAARALGATLSLVGGLVKSVRRGLGALTSFAGTLVAGHLNFVAITAAVSFSGGIVKAATKRLSAATSFAGTMKRAIVHVLSSAVSFTTTAFIAGVQVFFGAVVNLSGAINRQLSRPQSAALSLSGNIAKRTKRITTAVASFQGSITKRVSVPVIASISFVGNMFTGVIIVILTAAVGFSGAIAKTTRMPLVASLLPTAAIGKMIVRGFLAVTSFGGFILARKRTIPPTRPTPLSDTTTTASLSANGPDTLSSVDTTDTLS